MVFGSRNLASRGGENAVVAASGRPPNGARTDATLSRSVRSTGPLNPQASLFMQDSCGLLHTGHKALKLCSVSHPHSCTQPAGPVAPPPVRASVGTSGCRLSLRLTDCTASA